MVLKFICQQLYVEGFACADGRMEIVVRLKLNSGEIPESWVGKRLASSPGPPFILQALGGPGMRCDIIFSERGCVSLISLWIAHGHDSCLAVST